MPSKTSYWRKDRRGLEVTGWRGRRFRELLDDIKDRRGYSHLKEEVLDRTRWIARFGRGFGPVVGQTTEGIKECMNDIKAANWVIGTGRLLTAFSNLTTEFNAQSNSMITRKDYSLLQSRCALHKHAIPFCKSRLLTHYVSFNNYYKLHTRSVWYKSLRFLRINET
jgi:hypothetical protein